MHTLKALSLSGLSFLTALACSMALVVSSTSVFASEDENIDLLDRSAKAFASVVKKAGPAVVHVRVEKSVQHRGMAEDPFGFFNDPFFEKFFGPQYRHPREREQAPREFKQRGAGSGFIISDDGRTCRWRYDRTWRFWTSICLVSPHSRLPRSWPRCVRKRA